MGHLAIEPTIGTTSDGSLFFTAVQNSLRVDVLRSSDGARSWEIVSPTIGDQNAHLVTADPYLYTDSETDRIFTVDLTVACSFLSFSDDLGESWTTNPLACGRPVNDHQTLFAGPAVASPTVGYPNIVYYCFSDLANSACSKSLDGGITFVPTGSPAFAADASSGFPCTGWHGHGVVASDGTVYLPKGHCGEPWVAISRDEGLTWTRVRVAEKDMPSETWSDPSVALDEAGNVYYLWIGSDRLPYLAVSRDGGLTWSEPMMVGAPRVKEANLATIAADQQGQIAIAYLGSENSLHQRCRTEGSCRAVTAEPKTWNGYVAISDSALAKRPLFFSASVNKPEDPLIRGSCGPGRCPAVLDFIDVKIDRRGHPWATFVDGSVPGDGLEGEGLVATLQPPLNYRLAK